MSEIIPSSRHDRAVPIVLIGLGVALLLIALARLLVGDTLGWPEDPVILGFRMDRLIKAITVGVGLAVAGVLLQALLRNALASPYILGASSGAALGVMVSLWVTYRFSLSLFAGLPGMGESFAAVVGATLTLIVVYLLAQKRGLVDPLGLLLTGVIVNAINGAAIMFVNYLVPNQLRGDLMTYMMGHLDENVGVQAIFAMGPIQVTLLHLVVILVLAGLVVAVMMSRSIDVMTLSDAEAESVGLNIGRLRLVLYGVAGVLTAGTVVLAGPIGFVGLICPHFVRLLVGPRHRALIIGSALSGAALMVGADVAIKLVSQYYPALGLLPIGVLTAMIGGPIFLLMLRPRLGRAGRGGAGSW